MADLLERCNEAAKEVYESKQLTPKPLTEDTIVSLVKQGVNQRISTQAHQKKTREKIKMLEERLRQAGVDPKSLNAA